MYKLYENMAAFYFPYALDYKESRRAEKPHRYTIAVCYIFHYTYADFFLQDNSPHRKTASFLTHYF